MSTDLAGVTIDFFALHVVKMSMVRPAGYHPKTMTARVPTMATAMAAPRKTPDSKMHHG